MNESVKGKAIFSRKKAQKTQKGLEEIDAYLRLLRFFAAKTLDLLGREKRC
jgi:hypothetical protein